MVKEEELELICRLYERWRPGNIEVERIGGKTNRNFKVEDESGKWFVRIPYEKGDIPNRAAEAGNIRALKRASAKNKQLLEILPQFWLYVLKGKNVLLPQPGQRFNLPDGTMITNYIEGEELNAELLRQEGVCETLVKTVYIFHSSEARFVNPYDPIRDEVLNYKARVKQSLSSVYEIMRPSVLKEMEGAERTVEDELPLEKAVSTHNDLNFGNFILKGRVFCLTDWEYSGFNRRGGIYYDYGSLLGENFFHENPLKLQQFNLILTKASDVYGSKFDIDKAYCGAIINMLVCFWWGLLKYLCAETEERKEFYKEFAEKRIHGVRLLREIIDKKG